jgi:hypothetical protein
LVPAAAINAAMSQPEQLYGYKMALDPNKPLGPFNPPRNKLGIRNAAAPWHPLFNPLIWKAGCP